ncbi:MAG: penicillin-binding protein 1B [Pseudomonadota bacterium]
MSKSRSAPKKGLLSALWGFTWKLTLALGLVGGLFLTLYVHHLNRTVQEKFSGAMWALPAKVYARAMELYVGQSLSAEALERELARLGYLRGEQPPGPGGYQRAGGNFVIHVRRSTHWDGEEPERVVRLTVGGGQLRALSDAGGAALDILRLEAPLIGSFYPDKQEDRTLLRREEAPDLLVGALLAVEDRNFYHHAGVNPLAILRAALVNAVRGETVQGGSTITQQLAKNFFLTQERTLTRKFNEMLMALIMEYHYDKDAILEAYLNEIYLGQDGGRAIHGFGTASHFYFGRPIEELSAEQVALLVGLVKGASYYNPRRQPERALERRNVVLGVMADARLVPAQSLDELRARPLGVQPMPGDGGGPPAFMALVREQLKREYSEEALRTLGLRIYTTLDPEVQWQARAALARTLPELEKSRKLEAGSLQVAMVVTAVPHGEVQALIGDREPDFAGFNRALMARRQIGSLIKPAVYLSALRFPQRYSLATLLDDSPFEMRQDNGQLWAPKNYDERNHGLVPLYQALANSYNIPTIRLGLDVGLDEVAQTLRSLGVEPPTRFHPSTLLGTLELTPFEVAQMYQTLAAEGFLTPLRAIRAVLDAEGRPLQRFPINVLQTLPSGAVYLTDVALQSVVREGTARGLSRWVPSSVGVAGKTGTTNDLKDSWFAGFTGNRLGVVWVGRDDNQPTRLTGGSGAMVLWGELFGKLDNTALELRPPDEIEWQRAALPVAGQLNCRSVDLPFQRGYPPPVYDCGQPQVDWPLGEDTHAGQSFPGQAPSPPTVPSGTPGGGAAPAPAGQDFNPFEFIRGLFQ